VTFNVPLSAKLSLAESLALVAKQGYQRLLVEGEVVRLEDAEARLAATPRPASSPGHLTVVQDRLRLVPTNRARFIEACEQAYHFGHGKLTVWQVGAAGDGQHFAIRNPRFFSNHLHCADCDLEYREPTPALFSFNHPVGACPACKGFGRIISIDYDLAVPDRSLTLAGGAVRPWRSGFSAECQADLAKFCRARGVPMNVPFRELPAGHQRWVIEGDPDYGVDEEHEWPRAWYGIKGYFRWLESKAYKMHVRVLLSRYRAYTTCPECGGRRLKPEALLWRLRVENEGTKRADAPPFSILHPPPSLTLADFYALPIAHALAVIEQLAARASHPGQPASGIRPLASSLQTALEEVRARLGYLVEAGLGYLTLDRPTRTLSGGETERVNLTTCLGSRLVNTLFVLDEPSVGLHPRDTGRLIRILERLRDAGNTVVVVEHEASVMRAADQIVDLGPGHGETGGRVVFQGTFAELQRCPESLTGHYLSGRRRIEIPSRRPVASPKSEVRSPQEIRNPNPETRSGRGDRASSDFGFRTSDLPWLRLDHAMRHNLRDLSLAIPLGRFVCVTGVSGSGKSTLIREVLFPALRDRLGGGGELAPAGERLDDAGDTGDEADKSRAAADSGVELAGWEALGRVVMVDQAPLGRTPRSNPAVYIGAFDDIRELFAASEAARQRGLNASAFSFNSAQGQCERCRGAGFEKIEMQFLSDVFIRCPDCDGRRYREHVLAVRIQGAEAGNQERAVGREKSEVGRRKRGNRALAAGARPPPLAPHPSPGWSIADVLDATAEDVCAWLAGFGESRPARRAAAQLQVLFDVGLGYLRLGQPINTLSGGESQRLKLAAHLAESSAGVPPAPPSPTSDSRDGCATLFLFDEPTTGLHFEDVRVLLQVFQRLVDAGHSIIVIEHNLEVIKCADWVIDLGPEAGDEGGRLVVAGAPEAVAACAVSHTGQALRELGLATQAAMAG
jgi:excinuclease ABC subunit A